MSQINVNTITNRTGSGGPVISGLATAQNGLHVTGGGVNVTGIVTATIFSGSVETLNIDSVGIITAQSGVHFGLVGSGLTISSVGAGTSMGFFTDGSEALRIDSSGNLRFNSGYGSAATAYGCRAWVNLDGTGTVSIRESGNVSSITDRGTGAYTISFSTSMPDSNYSVGGSTGRSDDVSDSNIDIRALNTGSLLFNVRNQQSAVLVDRDIILIQIFR